jgi:UDP-N-acetylglucosamine 2-epimerase (non-hydrolysing)
MHLQSIIIVVGARPNFVKLAPLLNALDGSSIRTTVVHTGQHFDSRMSDAFFRSLQIRDPDVHLGVKGRTRAAQFAEIVAKLEPVLQRETPRAMCVVGDVTSTAAAAVAAASCDVPVAHIEAGLRSYDRTMPEEINRILTDSISEWFFVSEQAGMDILLREGHAANKMFLTGDLICDALTAHQDVAASEATWRRYNLDAGKYGVVTLHRPSNVDTASDLAECLSLVVDVSRRLPLVWPMHPRTRRSIEASALEPLISAADNLILCEPLDYIQFLSLLTRAQLVLSDSGGIQLEATLLDLPCLTLRTTTERPMTIERGTNTLVGRDAALVRRHTGDIVEGRYKHAALPDYWDGRTAERIVNILSAC